MQIGWAVPDANAEQWAALAIAIVIPMVFMFGEIAVRSFLRWLWRGGDE